MQSPGRRPRGRAVAFKGQARSVALGVTILMALGGPLRAQTFVQLPDMGNNVGPRLTRSVARARVQGRSLFGRISAKVSFIENGTVYQLASDPQWGRIMLGQWGQWVHGYTNSGGPGGALGEVEDIDISARKIVYIADRNHSRVLSATFSPGAQTLTPLVSWSGTFPRPTGLAWDGRTTPLSTDYVFVVDDSLNTISYWNASSGFPWQLVWSYGSAGSGIGQFNGPSAVCVGKSPTQAGGTQFTNSVYVVDRGNARLVRLDKTGPGWIGSVDIPGWQPFGCAVDFFGNVFVTDRGRHHLYKFTPNLTVLDSYGTFGLGASNLNTLAWPRSISVPCGLKVVNTQTVWYCEGRVLTAEYWSDSSGAVEHYLGVSKTLGQPVVQDPGASISVGSTDNAYVFAMVRKYDDATVRRTLVNSSLWPAGTWGLYWDGTLDNGQMAPSGNYQFYVSLSSAYSNPCCSPSAWSSVFYHTYCVPGGGGGGLNSIAPGSGTPMPTSQVRLLPVRPPPCGSADVNPGGRPVAFSVHQLPMAGLGTSEGITPFGQAAAGGPQLSVAAPNANASAAEREALRASVRAGGLTSLQIDLSETSAISAEILDLSGRRVRQFHADAQPAGSYLIHWEGSLDGGGHAPPGVYLTVVRAQGRESVSRLVITPSRSR